MAERSRRAKNLDKLAEYKRAREGGPRNWKVRDGRQLFNSCQNDASRRSRRMSRYMTRSQRGSTRAS